MKESLKPNRTPAKIKLLAASGALSGVLFSAGCSFGPEITEGTVVDKTDTPARDYVYLQPIPHQDCHPQRIGNITTEQCTTTFTYIPVPMHDDEKWSIKIQNCHVEGQDDGKCFDRDVTVSETIYNSIELGQDYTVQTK